jgi:hypothetical protein
MRARLQTATLSPMKESPTKANREKGGAPYARFRDALLDLSEEPTAPNIARYLEASRALDGQLLRDRPRQRSGRSSPESTL